MENSRTKKFLYFIQSGDKGPIKIGTTYDLMKRLKELQVGNPKVLRLLAATTTGYYEGGIHNQFYRSHIRGEWYRPVKDLLDLIKKIRDKNKII